ncbi:hypothetical protein ACT009_12190 [Sphingomonas sp. Tas61C01]|uniref:hypothetical protein n=1 Tax=Sphingomonas sp. Tas61C01 TaxID=3458297 RepID=UPI00403E7345
MANDDTNRLLIEIGQLLAEDTEYPLNGTLLYARVDAGLVAPSIFKEREKDIVFRWVDLDRLCPVLLDLWESEDGVEQWAEIQYVVRNEKFEVEYTYVEQIDPEEEHMVRRDRIVHRHFGDKPITYPDFPDDEDIALYDL